MAGTVLKSYEGAVAAEYRRRIKMWSRLRKAGGPLGVGAGLLRELRIYGGGQGIWVDKGISGSVSPDGSGVAVGLLHTGEYYNDLSADGAIYRYRRTARAVKRDLDEISAVKNAGLLGLPVFVVTTAGPARSLRDVRVGWVEDWDNAAMAFLVVFGTIRRPIPCIAQDLGRLFAPVEPPGDRLPEAPRRTSSEARFRFGVFRRCGRQCAVCDMAVPELLDIVRLKPRPSEIHDDPANGLVLCALHQRAYELGLFTIDPFTLHITIPSDGPSIAALNITRTGLNHLYRRSDTP
ncbi:MAG TPA: hypothetical protein DDZ84_05135 [Firmicutes bacterium]|nr:hypothetical protein [Bacillota bacterium]